MPATALRVIFGWNNPTVKWIYAMFMPTVRHSVKSFFCTQRRNLGIALCLCLIIGVAWQLLHTAYHEYRFTNNQAFIGFWEPEQYIPQGTTQVTKFRLSSNVSRILFQSQWSDFVAWRCLNQQITTLHVFAPLNQVATITIDNATQIVDYHARRIQLLQCQQSDVAITSDSPFVPTAAEPRHITFGLYNASRVLLPNAFFGGIALLVTLCIAGCVGGLIWINLWLLRAHTQLWWLLGLTFMTLCLWTQFSVVSGEPLLVLGGVLFTLFVLKPHVTIVQLRWVFIGMLSSVLLMRIGIMWWYVGGIEYVTAYPSILKQAIPLTYQPYWWWFCMVMSAQILIWIESPHVQRDGWWWGMLLFMVTVLQTITGYWNATGWSNTLDITAIQQWSAVADLLAHMRIAIPPILLISEYAIRDYPLFQTLYGWCLPSIAISVCIMLGFSATVLSPRERMVRMIISALLFITVIIIKGMLNFFIYDVLTSFFFVVYCQLLVRQQFTPTRAFMLGIILMCFDMMRPFTLVFVPLLALLGGYHIYKTQGWRRVLYFCAPLLVLVVWHANHILVLGQWNWTNHAGFNLCHAWPCPDVALLPEAPPLNSGLWPNINTAVHQINSQRLLHAFITELQTNPSMIMPTLYRLVQNNLFITRTLEVSIHPVITGVFTCIYIGGMVMQLVVVGNGLRNAYQRSWQQWLRQPEQIFFWYAVILLSMILITTITESGENYRWIIGFVLILGYFPMNQLGQRKLTNTAINTSIADEPGS
jgi:hypothetical protein